MRTIPIACALLCLAASPAAAAGLNFNWNTTQQCPTVANGDWSFACDTNDLVMYMVAEFTPNLALPGLNAMEARIDCESYGPIPAWWQAFNAGSCRENAFVAGVIEVEPTAPCAERLWTTQAYGGMGAWIYDTSNRLHIVIGFATAAGRVANLSTSKRYNAFHVAVSTSNTVSTPPQPARGVEEVLACDGCGVGMCLVLNQIGLYGAGGAEDQLYLPMPEGPGVNGIGMTYQGYAGCFIHDAARNTTWGQLKGMYR